MKIKVEFDTDSIFGDDSDDDIKHEVIERVSRMILEKTLYTESGRLSIEKLIREKLDPVLNEIRLKLKDAINETLNK